MRGVAGKGSMLLPQCEAGEVVEKVSAHGISDQAFVKGKASGSALEI